LRSGGSIGEQEPAGLVVHLVVRRGSGLGHLEVWESEAAWRQFHRDCVEPAVHQILEAGGFSEVPPAPPVEELDPVDVQLGS
jgi:hypothetical protein